MLKENTIIKILEKNKRGLSLTEISNILEQDRRTIAKKLEIMKAKGFVDYEQIGMAKLWSLSKSPIINLLMRNDEKSSVVKNILNSLDEGISILNKELKIIWVNDKIKKMVPKVGNLTDRKCYVSYLNRDERCPGCAVIEAFKTKKTKKLVDKGKDKNGKKYYYQFVASPIKDREGNVIAVIECVRDLSEIKGL
jgi:transcriptional regulator with PAS, ATPase and Fis domain